MVAPTTVKEGLTFDDVFIVPAASNVLPSEADLRTRFTRNISINIPLVSAAMDTVTGSDTAIAIARQGGIGIIHKNMSIERQAAEVEKAKRSGYWIVTKPVTVSKDTTIAEINDLKAKYGISSFPVVDKDKLVGIVTDRDLVFQDKLQTRVKDIMTTKLITIKRKIELDDAKQILSKNKIEKLPIVDEKGRLKGLITSTDILNTIKYPHANKDRKGRVKVGAAVGPKDDKRVEALIGKEVDVIVIDTSHGHSYNVIEAVKRFKKNYDTEIIAGNIATGEAAKALIKAGADAIKVGVGPGAICTTRIIAGVGVPQITAIKEAAKAADAYNIPVIADGGIKYSGDITKALAAGASTVMIGSLFAGCDETPGKVIFLNNRKFKQYRGMGSLGAMVQGSKDRYFQGDIMEKSKLVPEGIEGIVPYKGTIAEVVYQLIGGLRSGMGLAGCATIEELRKKAKFVKITNAGLAESHPHDVAITEESPNYSPNGLKA
jgi:IMP dehydrogenase